MNEFDNRVRSGILEAKTVRPTILRIETQPSVRSHLPFLHNVAYVPDVVAQKMTSSAMIGKDVHFAVHDTEVRLSILHTKQRVNCSECFFVEFVKTVVVVIKNVFRKTLPRIDVVLVMLCLPKKLNAINHDVSNTRKVVSHDNINTGYSSVRRDSASTVSDDVPYTYVYRTEEMCKVLIHELLHMYGVHSFHAYPRSCDTKIVNRMGLDVKPGNSLNLFESYVEMCSLVINSAMYDDYFGSSCDALAKEVKNSENLVNQMTTYRPYREETNVYAYVFLKYDLLLKRDDVLSQTRGHDFVLNDVATLMPFVQDHTHHKENYNTKLTLNKMDIYACFAKRFKDFLSIHE